MATGDREAAFEKLFRANHDKILAYALRRAHPGDAEDIVAETFAVAWRRFDAIPPDPLPWLYGVARRTLANSRRTTRRRAHLTSRLAADLGSSSRTDPDPADRLDATAMRAALDALMERDREALMLVAWEGLDHRRAALVLGISPETFAVRLHRARRRLQTELDRLAEAEPLERRSPSEGR